MLAYKKCIFPVEHITIASVTSQRYFTAIKESLVPELASKIFQ